jgi:hypothetical protein
MADSCLDYTINVRFDDAFCPSLGNQHFSNSVRQLYDVTDRKRRHIYPVELGSKFPGQSDADHGDGVDGSQNDRSRLDDELSTPPVYGMWTGAIAFTPHMKIEGHL